ncbi:unnamed protein product [Lymnaea stagnalis]|uniref:Uncharacterized protein n=1 Tax=Lymnaea stagnalis TaxID=6523 RepID=A0AAV2HRY7_LYMST
MTSSHVTCAIVLVTILSACTCPSLTFDLEEQLDDTRDKERRAYIPAELTQDTILDVLKAHALTLQQLESAISDQKRTSAAGAFPARPGGDFPMRGMKRKMFWQPLGYLPASARAQNISPGQPKPDNQETGSNVFRYG